MNTLFCSNYGAFSAYSLQANLFVPQMVRDGHPTTVYELAGSQRRQHDIGGVPILSPVHDPQGNDMVRAYAQHVKADVVLTLTDVWRFNPDVWRDVNWWAWVPVDHLPVPPLVEHALTAAAGVIAMSYFGQRALQDMGIDALYAPLAVDERVFKPIPKAEARRVIGWGDEFRAVFVGVNDSNPNRKGIPELLIAWQTFVRAHPDARLYLHTAVHGNLPTSPIGGVQIDTLMKTLSIPVPSVEIVEQTAYRIGMPQERLALILAAADVVVLPSRGEGFGMPVIEAQACGTPVITTDFAAGSELLFAGWRVDYHPEWSAQNAFVAKPDIQSLVDGLEAAYDARHDANLRAIATEAARAYHFSTVYPIFRGVLQQMAERTLERLSA